MKVQMNKLLIGILTLGWAMVIAPLTSVHAEENMPKVRLTTTMGDIVLELNREKAPLSVDNFLQYVNDGFYNGTVFHRVIDGFMIQGGGFTQNLQRKKTRPPIKNEADNGLKNDVGTVAMARTNDPHSATAQFFINVVNNDFLNYRASTLRGWGYAVFGKVVEGMDVVNKIKSVQTGPSGPFRKNVPRTPVVIESAMVVAPDASQAPQPPAPPGGMTME